MPRAKIWKAQTAVRRAAPHHRYYDLNRQPTVIERIVVTIFDVVMTRGTQAAVIEVERDIIRTIIGNAPMLGDLLGPRIEQTIHQGLSRLEHNEYIGYLSHRDDVERIQIKDDFQTTIQELADKLVSMRSTIEGYSIIQRYRFKCGFFRTKLSRNFKRNLTRRELDVENRRLIVETREHSRICPILQVRSSSVVTDSTEVVEQDQTTNGQSSTGPSPINNEPDDADSMYVDDVPRVEPVASGSNPPMPRTPIRRSHTLNNPDAYPSPESAVRPVPPAPLTPERTPSRSRSVTTTGTVDDDPSGDDGDVDMGTGIDDELPRTSSRLFIQDVLDSPEVAAVHTQIAELYATLASRDVEHKEKLAAMEIEFNERLAVQKVESDERFVAQRIDFEEQLAAQRIDFDGQLMANSGERDRWWLGRFNSLRKTFRFRTQIAANQAKGRLEMQKAQNQREMQPLIREQEEQHLREKQAHLDQVSGLKEQHQREKQGLLDKITGLQKLRDQHAPMLRAMLGGIEQNRLSD